MQRSRDKIAEMKSRRRTILSRDKKYHYKEQTHRLAKIGLIAEKYFDCKDIDPWEFEEMLQEIMEKGYPIR